MSGPGGAPERELSDDPSVRSTPETFPGDGRGESRPAAISQWS